MRYCLTSTKKLDKQLRKLLQSLNEQVSLSLLLACRDPESGIHEARKCCKESRALVRLLRPQIGKPEYQRLNGFYRTVARELSGNRDAVVMLTTWHQICSELPALQAGSRRSIDDFLERNIADTATNNIEKTFFLNLSLEVNSQHEAADKWTVPDSIGSLKPTIKRIYKKARDAEKTARSSADIEGFHCFRKRSKDLCHKLAVKLMVDPPATFITKL